MGAGGESEIPLCVGIYVLYLSEPYTVLYNDALYLCKGTDLSDRSSSFICAELWNVSSDRYQNGFASGCANHMAGLAVVPEKGNGKGKCDQ